EVQRRSWAAESLLVLSIPTVSNAWCGRALVAQVRNLSVSVRIVAPCDDFSRAEFIPLHYSAVQDDQIHSREPLFEEKRTEVRAPPSVAAEQQPKWRSFTN